MFAYTPTWLHPLLACPVCKSAVEDTSQGKLCTSCRQLFPLSKSAASRDETWVDFRLKYPPALLPRSRQEWARGQLHFESGIIKQTAREPVEALHQEINMVRHVYESEFEVGGRILDVGGHRGKLRHFLSPADRDRYVCLDPFAENFDNLPRSPVMLEAYPSLREPCPFVAGEAEHLPFASATFDLVHIRSAIDHFADPYLALLDARRVLKANGRILIGTTVEDIPGNRSTLAMRALRKIRHDGVGQLFASTIRHVTGSDPHLFHWTQSSLTDTLQGAGFEVRKTHRTPAPHEDVVYVEAIASNKAPAIN